MRGAARLCQGILLPALKHVGSIMLFIFAVTLALNAVVEFIGEDSLKSLLGGSALLQPVIAAIFGFIPNCAASVVITELYISGGLGFGGGGGALHGSGHRAADAFSAQTAAYARI